MNIPNKCPYCLASRVKGREYACGFIFREGVKHNPRPHECLLNSEVSAHAATKRELSNTIDTIDLMRDEFQRIRARIVEKGCDETGLGNELLELCTRAMSGITQRVSVIAQRDAAQSELESLRARVAELEGLRITGTHYFSDYVGVAVTLPIGSAPTIGGTLGDAMQRKE